MPLLLPAMPNKPLHSITDDDPVLPVALRTNAAIGLTENSAFDPAAISYTPDYQNSQEYSQAFQSHMREMLARITESFHLDTKIVEVGCGKGAFVAMLQEAGYRNVIGFDPAYEGTNPDIHRVLLGPHNRINAGLVILRHTLEHIQRPHMFLKMIADIRDNKDCAVFIEVPCFEWIRRNGAFFDVTYEHVNYFSLPSLRAMFDGKFIASGHCFGGQYIFAVAKLADLSADYAAVYDNADKWQAESFENLFPSLVATINQIETQARGKAFLWGAGTKGCLTLYHAVRLGALVGRVPFAIDINPGKVGKFLPGSKIAIRSKNDFFATATPNDILIIANPIYQDEIRRSLNDAGLGEIKTIFL